MFDKKTNVAAQEAFGAAVNSGSLDALDDLVAADSVDHDPAPGQAPGAESAATLSRSILAGSGVLVSCATSASR